MNTSLCNLFTVLTIFQPSLNSAQFIGGSSINLAFPELTTGVLYEFRITGNPPLDDVVFNIIGGQDDLTVNETGFLLVTGTLDFESQPMYELSVEAVNVNPPSSLASATVSLQITNINDHTPTFTQNNYTVYLPYEGDPSTYDISSMCSDSDAPPYNALTFTGQNFNPQSGSQFFVVQADGIIRRNQDITSARTAEEYQFSILCHDSPDAGDNPRADSAAVTVVAQALNSGPPVFQPPLVFSVTETKNTNIQVGTITVTDPDPQDPVTVEITGGASARFQLQSVGSGQYALVSIQELDRESSPSLVVILTARDGPENFYRTQSSSATITVNLEDVNDNSPHFANANVMVTIARSYPLNIPVVNLRCTDDDVSDEITYSRSSGEVSVFYIEPSNGSIFLAQDVVRSSLRERYFLTVVCTDGLNQDVGFIDITVTSNNTRAPQFSHSSHVSLNISEDTAVNTVIFDVNATDDDGDSVSYHLVEFASNTQYFSVDSVSGKVTLKQALDFEGNFSQFGLPIEAVDDASQPLTSTVTISVQVENVNDQPPSFDSTSYAVVVPESNALVTPLTIPQNFFQAQCQDPEDLPVTIKYSIIQVDPDPSLSGFDLVIDEDTGYVSSTGPIDYETIGPVRYTATLQCYDMDQPNLNSSVPLDVTIMNVNEYRPTTDGGSIALVNESLPIGHVIISFNSSIEGLLKVNVTDRDRNTVFRYSLTEETPLFSINNERSVLVSAAALDTDDPTLISPLVCSRRTIMPYCRIVIPISICDDERASTDCLARQYFLIAGALNDENPMFEQNRYETDVNEGLTGTAVVLAIRCTDADQYIGGELTVTIVDEPSAEEFFDVSPTAVTLRTGKTLDYENRISYNFLVQCTDGTNTVTADIIINVLAVNEYTPTFTNTPYIFSISKTTVPSVISILSVTDGDIGVGGTLEYSLEPAGSTFDVTKTSDLTQSALFFLRQDLSTSTESRYEYNVTVTDGFSTTVEPITVIITDGNFHRPQWEAGFGPISLRTFEHNPVGSLVHTLSCTDGDAPNTVNSLITYSFQSPNRHFSINNETGVISIASVIIVPEGATSLDFTLGIQCADNGDPQLIQNGDVYIYVAAVPDNATILTPGNAEDIVVSVPENLEVNGVVSNIVTENFEETQFLCTINDTIGLNSFFVTNQYPNCTIRLKTPLDADLVTSYFFPVTVSDTRYVTVNVTVFVQDVNDNEPNCSQINGREFQVEVTREINSLVAELNCVDVDVGRNGEVSYTLDHPLFGIMPPSSLIVKANLSTSSATRHVLEITASDMGLDMTLSTMFYVTVVIDLVNIGPPAFENLPETVIVEESTPISSVIFRISASDPDTGFFGDLVFSEVSGDLMDFFLIENQGNVRLLRALDAADSNTFNITVSVSDPDYAVTSTLSISVREVNDFAPVCTQDIYVTALMEGSGERVYPSLISCDDLDSGASGTLNYTIQPGLHASFFTVSSDGTVRVAPMIDFEEFTELTVSINVSDQGTPARSIQVTVRVIIIPVNEHTPMILNADLQVVISEGITVGSKFYTFEVSDQDRSTHRDGQFVVFLDGTDNADFVVLSNGDVMTAAPLDFERQESYSLTVTVRDDSNMPRSSTATFTIILQNENDLPPMLSEDLYTGTIRSSDGMGATGVQITCTDTEFTPTRPVTLSLLSAPPFLTVDATGNIIIINSVPEEDRLHVFDVECSDSGMPVMTARSTVSILVSAGTPNITFDDATPQRTISESTPVFDTVEGKNTRILTVIARAPGTIVYSMTHDTFFIEERTGIVRLKSPLDYESATTYSLIIRASLSNSPTTYNELQAQVNVRNENDNQPVFLTDTFTISLNESSTEGLEDAVVECFDNDADPFGTVQYFISANTLFEVSRSTGRISLLGGEVPDYEEASQYVLTVTCSDGELTDEVTVFVEVLPVNEFPPQITSDTMAMISESTGVGAQVKRIIADDADDFPHDTIRYYISGGNEKQKFQLNEVTGELFLISNLDYEEDTMFDLQIEVRDDGEQDYQFMALSSTTAVTILVTDENDNSPVFTKEVYIVSVRENASIATVIETVNCTDKDSDQNGVQEIVITNGEDNPVPFRLSTSLPLGFLEATVPLEPRPYIVQLMCSDGGMPPRTASSVVIVSVTPRVEEIRFTMNLYSFAVPELESAAGHVIGTIEAYDNITDTFTYEIVGRNDSTFFVSASSGDLLLLRALDYENPDDRFFTFTVQAAKPDGASAEVAVAVSVLNQNDGAPMFLDTFYFGQARESQLPPLLVPVGISCTDVDDSADGSPSLLYTLEGTDSFIIDETSGALNTKSVLDVESLLRHQFTVVCTDSDGLSTTASVHVTVLPFNDFPPMFPLNNYQRDVIEGRIVSSVIQVIASDLDFLSYGTPVYSIVSGDPENRFSINTAGIIRVVIPLDYETQTQYRLTVQATDVIPPDDESGSVQMSDSTTVTIDVIDVNDVHPLISPADAIVTNLKRDSPIGSMAVMFTCTDQDSGNAGRVELSIVSDEQDFELNSAGYLVTTMTPLQAYYYIEVMCRDFGSPSLSATATVVVSANSTNLNRPEFVNLEPTITIEPDDLNRTDCVYVVDAQDADGSNTPDGTLRFTLSPVPSTRTAYFAFNSTASCIYPVNGDQIDLGDRNTVLQFTYRLTVEDNGVPPLSDSVLLQILISANMAPSLPASVDPIDFAESSSPSLGEDIQDIPCHDVDFNDPLTMTISEGNDEGIFGISVSPKSIADDGRGMIVGTVAIQAGRQLDYDAGTRGFALTIQCSDGLLAVTTSVMINVLPVNEHVPTFVGDGRFDIPENVYVGYRVTTLVSTDRDAGEDGNVQFQLNTSDPVPFSLAPSGELTVSEALDYDTGDRGYPLTIVAYDRAASGDNDPRRKMYSSTVMVFLENINDEPPKFPEGIVYNFTVDATQGINSTIGMVSCTDEDLETATVISYTLLNQAVATLFLVDSSSGEIRVASDLLQREFDSYGLLIQCSDSGSPILGSITEVRINIDETNSHSPLFVNPPSLITVPESHNLTEVIQQFIASDNDPGLYGKLTFSIDPGTNQDDIFTITPSTGELKLLRLLDFEKEQSHALTIVVTDGAEDSANRMSATTQFTVHVSNVNERAPICTQPLYIGYVSESTSVNAIVLQLNCSGGDKSDPVTYALGVGNLTPFNLEFTVGRDGDIRLAVRLFNSEETEEFYKFVVLVTDFIIPQRITNIDVQIAFLFGNVDAPMFNQSTYSWFLKEDTAIGTNFATVAAADSDRGIQGQVTYSLAGPDANFFRINSETGAILLASTLDRESVMTLNFEVVATDGDPYTPRVGNASVIIEVQDVNDNHPLCIPMHQTVPILSDIEAGTVVAQLSCTDADMGDNRRLVYSVSPLTPGTPFSVNSSSGSVMVEGTLQPSTSFLITIVVSDFGSPSLKSEVDVVLEVYRKNRFPPLFGRSEYNFNIDETIAVLDSIGSVAATDSDSPVDSLRYRLAAGNPDFYVDPESGLILVTAPMDFETLSRFVFSVIVEDGGSFNGSDILSDTATVTVTVSNVNDHVPELSGSGIYGTIVNVTTAMGTSILEFMCEDADFDSFGEVTVSQDPIDIPFALQGSSGLYSIVVNEDLTKSGGTSYTANISCSDGMFSTVGQVFIAILRPGNPKFSQVVYQWNIPEDTPVGSNFTQISAETTSGTALTYSITDGNEDGHFRINRENSILQLAFSVDYELQRRHGLIVRATDGNGNFSEVLVIVNVLDISESSDLAPPSGRYVVAHDTPVNEPFGQLKCSNNTLQRGDTFNFTFIPPSDVFGVDEYGTMRLLKQLDETPIHVLPVICYSLAIDEPEVASGIVTITVRFENNHVPTFDLDMYTVIVPENLNASESVTQVVARDSDIGSFGEFSYAIESGNFGNKFFINSTTGDISLLSALDFEMTSEYNLTVVAVDGGATAPDSKRFTGSTTVFVRVGDANDNIPVFSQPFYEAAILTDHSLLGSVINVSCSDQDSGVNKLIDYDILPDSDTFTISREGNILLTGDLENEAVYTLRVFCIDGGTPSLSSSVQVIIIVSPIRVGAPVFDQASYNISIPEDHPVLGDFLRVSATPENINIGVSYSIVDGEGDGADQFGIDPSSGSLFTTARLNAVQKSTYYLFVSAQNVGPNELSSRVIVSISVTDINNNVPVFTPSNFYRGIVSESAVQYQSIVSVTCEDGDLLENAEVSYQVSSSNSLFDVSSDGVVFVNAALDYETSVDHTITITCRDSGTPPQSSTATVLIRVTPVNEYPPMFTMDTYTVPDVAENTEVGSIVGQVAATDGDNGRDGMFSFRVIEPNPSFHVNSDNGSITVIRPLDYETSPEHTLNVLVEDEGGEASTAQLVIQLSDVNDNNPVLTPTAAAVDIHVSERAGFLVQRFVCEDEDTVPAGGPIVSITSSSPKFVLDANSQLVMNDTFDSPAVHNVIVYCDDRGGRSALTSAVAITIYEDRNLIPQFLPSNRYETTIDEGYYSDVVVYTVNADTQSGSPVTFTRYEGDSEFSVDASSGAVRLNGTLNRQVKAVLHVIIQASANGHSSLAVLIVRVRDVNDNVPTIIPVQQTIFVQETISPPASVSTIICEDSDEGSNGETFVSIPSGQVAAGLFGVTPDGVLSVVAALDYDSGATQYNITVMCSDRGSEPQTARGTVIIIVQPVNEYRPVFDPSVYSTEVSEAFSAGSTIQQLNVSDLDGGNDGLFSLRVTTSIGSTDFAINGQSLAIDSNLNASRQSFYNLEVAATDRGFPISLTGYADVTVSVTDVNEAPYFSEEVYEEFASVELESGSIVGSVTCSDGDINQNAELEIIMTNTGDADSFLLATLSSQPGQTVARIFTDVDELTLPMKALTFVCSDGGMPSLSATSTMEITIAPRNERPPVFVNFMGSVTVEETASVPVVVYVVYATDVETPTGITYAIVGGNINSTFSIDGGTREVTLIRRLDYEVQSSYNLTIRAYDASRVNQMFADVTLFVNILNKNDFQPVITGPSAIALEETQPTGETLTQFTCTDRDGFEVTFSVEGDQYNQFVIDSRNGNLQLLRPLDYEETSEHSLTIVCTDMPPKEAGLSLSSSQSIVVSVTAVNFYAPVFEGANSSVPYMFSVLENTEVSMAVPVGQVNASDPDNRQSAVITYTIVESDPDILAFVVNRLTGVISLVSFVDREKNPSFRLTIEADDGDMIAGPLTSSVNVTINIADVNDNRPICTKETFVHLITEGEYDRLSLAALNCSDADEGPNGDLSYTIVSQDNFGGVVFQWNVNEGTLELTGRVLPGVIDLSVQVSDQGTPAFSLNVQVIVNIQVNDSESLRFIPAAFTTAVSENETIGVVIFNGEDFKAALMFGTQMDPNFALQSSDNEVLQLFSIEESTGDMILNRELNYENRTEYGIVIMASDDQYVAFATLVVEVADVNDNKPVFSQPDGYQASINENAIVMVIQVQANDVDTGDGGRVSYSLVETPNSQFFTIDSNTGWISTMMEIDYELFNQLILQVVASDNGSPRLTSQALVTVSVNNLNDNPPTFNQSEYVIYITDSDPVGSRLARLRASDADNLRALDFRVSPDPCPDPSLPRLDEVTQLFDVDDITQELKLIGSVPTGVSTNYYFTVYVSDGEELGKTCVNVFVREVTLLEAVILETDVIGTFRYDLTQKLIERAFDVTARTVYTIIGGNDDGVFGVTNSDTIVNEMKLDREEMSEHRLLIDVLDQETGVNVTALLRIVVQDINDNTPMFTEASYSFTVMEGTRDDPGAVILGTFVAEDPDFLLNGEVRYKIDSEDTRFSLNNINGELALLAILDREITPQYNFNVIAEDLGVDSRSSSAAVMVTVSDINDSPPVFVNPVTQASILPGASAGSLLVTLTVTDADEGSNADISFTLTYDPMPNEELFTVIREIPSSGRYVARVQAVRTILEENNGINISLKAMDGGEPAQSTMITFALSVKNTPPEFPTAVYTSQVLFGEDVDKEVLVVTATDHDRQRVSYTIQLTEVGFEIPFAVNSENGAVTTNNPITLNWPHKYLFEVIAEDNNEPTHGRATVFVAVNIYNASHLLILKSCNSTTVLQSNQEQMRAALEDWYNNNGFSGSLFVHNVTGREEADESRYGFVASALCVTVCCP